MAYIVQKFKLLKTWFAMGEIIKLFRVMIKEHQDTFEPDHIRDFVDIYIQKMKLESNKENPSRTFVELFKQPLNRS